MPAAVSRTSAPAPRGGTTTARRLLPEGRGDGPWAPDARSGVSQAHRGAGVGHLVIEELLDRARAVGVERVFCLTFEVEFFRRHGFEVMADQSAVDPEVYAELLRSTDEGVAEFLDLARVKPNTLGNTRMIRRL